MVAGWPIAHHVWAGNKRDSTTVKEVVDDLSKRFSFRRVVFVGDRGMVTKQNLETIRTADGSWGLVVGMTRRRNPEAEQVIDRVRENDWVEWPGGINVREKRQEDHPHTRVQEVACDRPGVRIFVVDSDQRHHTERRARAHTFVAALSFLCDRMLERTLKDAQVNLSFTSAWKALATIRHVTFRVGTELRTGVTSGNVHARQVLRALKLSDLRPPTPPTDRPTTM